MEVMRERGFETDSARRGWAVDPGRKGGNLRGTLDITVKTAYGLVEDYGELLRVANGMMQAIERRVLPCEQPGIGDGLIRRI